jgi:hypothetical protein
MPIGWMLKSASGQVMHSETSTMRIGEVARRAGVNVSLVRYYDRIGLLPEIDALIDRAQRVRAWMERATGCECERIDQCALFDDAALPTAA